MTQIHRYPRPAAGPARDSGHAPAGEPLSAAQRRAWFMSQWAPGVPLMHLPIAVRLRGPLDVDRLRGALSRLVAGHSALNTCVVTAPDGPVRVPAPSGAEPSLRVVDAGTGIETVIAAACDRLRDLGARPPLDASLLVADRDEHVLVLVTHRVAVDEWSAPLLLEELGRAYSAALPPPVPPAAMKATAIDPANLAYWTDRLAGLPRLDLDLLLDSPVGGDPGWSAGVVHDALDATFGAAVDRLATGTGTGRRAVLLAAYGALLRRYTGEDDLVVGTMLPGRAAVGPHTVGSFANPVVLRLAVPGSARFADLARAADAALRGADDHQHVPFDRVVAALGANAYRGAQPVFRTALQLDQPAAPPSEWPGGLRLEPIEVHPGVSTMDLAVRIAPAGAGFGVSVEYRTGLFDAGRMRRMVRHLGELVRGAAREPDTGVDELPVLDRAERGQVVVTWNATEADYGTADRCLHELIEERAARAGGDPAIRFEGASTSYAELNTRANQLARHLRDAGVGPERIVGVMVERGPKLPLALLAILKAGGAYLPLDPDHPPERVAFQVADAACRVVVTTTEFAGRLPDSVRAVALDDPQTAAALAALSDVDLGRTAVPDNLAYVIFTSGSTGRPKGVQIAHRAVVNYVGYCQRAYRIGPGDRVMQFNNPCFDPSVFDFFAALTTGATLVQAPNHILHGARSLADYMRAERVTFADLPPIIPQLLDPAAVPELRSLNCGGEALPGDVVDRWQAPGREIWNTYGPTEATVVCTDYLCPPDRSQPRTPIGVPLGNLQAYVVDRNFAPVPIGVPGELLIGGVMLARGYLNRAALTAERFVPDPFGPPGGRLYRTGDVARWLPDGNLDFLGRIDRQIKLHGHRIEPSEVEGAIVAHRDVAQVVVDVHHTVGNLGDLVAYVVPARDAVAPTAVELRSFLRGKLPAYFIPNRVVALDALPLTPNGKVDRRALPAPAEPAGGGGDAGGPLHARIAAVWTDLLGVPGVRADDSFFALGGDSIAAAVMLARLRASLGVQVDLPAFFAEPTPAALATAAVRQLRSAARPGRLTR